MLSSHEQQIRDDSGRVHAAKAEAPALPGTRRPVRSACAAASGTVRRAAR